MGGLSAAGLVPDDAFVKLEKTPPLGNAVLCQDAGLGSGGWVGLQSSSVPLESPIPQCGLQPLGFSHHQPSLPLAVATLVHLGVLAGLELPPTPVGFHCGCSVAQLYPTLCDPMDSSTPGFPVLHHLPELAQTHVHGAGDAIQPLASM